MYRFLKFYFVITILSVAYFAMADYIEEYRGTLTIGSDPNVTAVKIAPGGTELATINSTDGLTIPNNTPISFKDSTGTTVRAFIVRDSDDTRIITKSGKKVEVAFGTGNGTSKLEFGDGTMNAVGSLIIGNTQDGTSNSQTLSLCAGTTPSPAQSAFIDLHSHAFGGNVDIHSTSSGELRWYGSGASPVMHLKRTGIIDYRGTMGDSTKNPAVDAPTDWVEVQINGTTYYLPAYTGS